MRPTGRHDAGTNRPGAGPADPLDSQLRLDDHLGVEEGGYLWRGELRLWDNDILMGWYAANDGSVRSKGTMYFVITPTHAAESLSKGSRVVILGRLQQRAWTAEDGSARSVVEVVAEELGRACAGRRQPRPGPRGVRASSQLDQ